jgi:salicylate hydroxylase
MGVRVIAGRSAYLPANLAKGVAMLMGGDQSSLFTASYTSDECVWGLTYKSDTRAMEGEKAESMEGMIATARERGGDVYGEYFTSMLDKPVPGSVRVLNCYDMMPVPGIGRVTFIGDACHPVSPLTASGANLALEDGWVLAEGVMKWYRSRIQGAGEEAELSEVLRDVEKKRAPSAIEAIHGGRKMLSTTLATGWRHWLACAQWRALSLLINHPWAIVAAVVGAVGVVGGLLWSHY